MTNIKIGTDETAVFRAPSTNIKIEAPGVPFPIILEVGKRSLNFPAGVNPDHIFAAAIKFWKHLEAQGVYLRDPEEGGDALCPTDQR